MALPVLDGNQSATTLSSVVTGGEHIVAHSVVSLGTTAISNIATAVSGVYVSISGTPSTTFGAVTGSVSILGTPTVTIPGLAHLGNSVATDGVADATTNFIKIGGHQSGQNQTSHIVHVSAGGSMSVDASGSSVTFSQAPVTFGAITGSASILNFPSTQTIAGTVTANAKPYDKDNILRDIYEGVDEGVANDVIAVHIKGATGNSVLGISSDPLAIFGTVTVGNTVTIGSLPAISGTVTANLSNLASHASSITKADKQIQIIGGYSGGSPTNATAYPLGVESTGYINSNLRWGGTGVLVDTGASALPVQGTVTIGNSVTIGSLPAISGTVTANVPSLPIATNGNSFPEDGPRLGVELLGQDGLGLGAGSNIIIPISGTVTVANSVTIGSLPAISGTVTAAAPNGSLTTRFGTPTTANVSFATSAVTNANRKYLLIQNVTTGSNVITVGIGFTPTTTQGIQLTAGAGITFESSYIPTGAVQILSSVTASNFTILEA